MSSVKRFLDGVVQGVRRWRAPAAAPHSYERARANLDGAVSRDKPSSTDAWFVIDGELPPDEQTRS